MAETICGLLVALIIGDVLYGGAFLTVEWLLWRSEVRFKRRYSFSDPRGFFEFRDWIRRSL